MPRQPLEIGMSDLNLIASMKNMLSDVQNMGANHLTVDPKVLERAIAVLSTQPDAESGGDAANITQAEINAFRVTFHDGVNDRDYDDSIRAGLEAALAARQPVGVEPVAYIVGNQYRTQAGELVRFVAVHNEGTSYECMEDESGVNRYTRRDFGRVTGSPHDYSEPRNTPPLYNAPPAQADRLAIKMLVAAGFVSEEKANESLRIAHGFGGDLGQPAPAAVPVDELDLDRVLSLADVHAAESHENGTRLLDRGGLMAFAQDVAALATHPQPAAAEPSNRPDSKREQELQKLERKLGLKREQPKPAAAGGDA